MSGGTNDGKTTSDGSSARGDARQPGSGQAGNGGGDSASMDGKPWPVKDEVVAKLFKPDKTDTRPSSNTGTGGAGTADGKKPGLAARLGVGGKTFHPQDFDAIADPVERSAAKRLQEAIKRIQANRDRRLKLMRPGQSDPADQTGRRDW